MEEGFYLTSGCGKIHSAALKSEKLLKKILSSNSSAQLLEEKDGFGRTPLIYAVLGNNVENVKSLLLAGAQADNGDAFGQTPLHWAAFKGYYECCKVLLAAKARWKRGDNEGVTPLHLAARNDNPKCLRLFSQEAPQNYDLRDKRKKTPLHWSAAKGNIQHLKILLKMDANVNIPDAEGKTPLHWAASLKSERAVECVEALLEVSPSVIGWQDYQGRTALHLAVIAGSLRVVDVLSQSGKCLDLLDNWFRSSLHWASLLGFTEKVCLLLDRRANYLTRDAAGATALHYAVKGNNCETVAAFLSRSFVVDEADSNADTAFHWAAALGSKRLLNVFAQRTSFSLSLVNKKNISALHMASYWGHSSCVDLLLSLGCHCECRSANEMTPLLTAAEMGKAKVVKVLIEKGANLFATDSEGRTALHCACVRGHALVCQYLTRNGISINQQDRFGFTPLHYCCLKGYANCASILLENGANPLLLDNLGYSALHWACLKGRREMVRLLIERGVATNILARNQEGKTPLDCAWKKDHKEIVSFLISRGALTAAQVCNVAAKTIQNYYRRWSKARFNSSVVVEKSGDYDCPHGDISLKAIENNEKSSATLCPFCSQTVPSRLSPALPKGILRYVAAVIIQRAWRRFKMTKVQAV